jgi:hypothetical protein
MLSFASAAFLADKTLVGTFSANLETLPGATSDDSTMRWWKTQPKAWDACREDLQPPSIALPAYRRWLEGLPGQPVFVGYPASFDFMFVYWYLIRYAGESPYSYAALDIRSYGMALQGSEFLRAAKRFFPAEWFDDLPHTHLALDDAIAQGALFCNMLAIRKRMDFT